MVKKIRPGPLVANKQETLKEFVNRKESNFVELFVCTKLIVSLLLLFL